jgi:hypothetical protein
MLNKASLNLLTDCLAFLFLIGMLLTGFILWWPLPAGTNKDRLLWSLSRHDWGAIHTWLSLGLLAVLAVHLIQHWKWLLGMFRKRFPSKQVSDRQWSIIVVGTLLIFLLVFFAATTIQVKKVPDSCAFNYIEDFFVGSAFAEKSSAVKIFDEKCIKCHGLDKVAAEVDLKIGSRFSVLVWLYAG